MLISLFESDIARTTAVKFLTRLCINIRHYYRYNGTFEKYLLEESKLIINHVTMEQRVLVWNKRTAMLKFFPFPWFLLKKKNKFNLYFILFNICYILLKYIINL